MRGITFNPHIERVEKVEISHLFPEMSRSRIVCQPATVELACEVAGEKQQTSKLKL